MDRIIIALLLTAASFALFSIHRYNKLKDNDTYMASPYFQRFAFVLAAAAVLILLLPTIFTR